MKRLHGLVVVVLVCALAGMSALGCNTMRGAGKDIQRGGQAVEDTAEGAQSRM